MPRKKKRKPTYNGVLSRVGKTKIGRKLLGLYRKFHGLKKPSTIKVFDIPGKGKKTFVGLGVSPALTIADGPNKERARKIKRYKRRGYLLSNAGGTKMFVLYPKRKGRVKKKKFLGWAVQTEYVPTRDTEKDGSPKRGKHWIHTHGQASAHEKIPGKWPKVYELPNGMIEYARGTYRISDWIRR